MLISRISSNVRALYIVSALAETKLGYVNVSQPFNLFNSDTFTTGFLDLERLTLLTIARVGKECLLGFHPTSRKIGVYDHNVPVSVYFHMGVCLYLPAEM